MKHRKSVGNGAKKESITMGMGDDSAEVVTLIPVLRHRKQQQHFCFFKFERNGGENGFECV